MQDVGLAVVGNNVLSVDSSVIPADCVANIELCAVRVLDSCNTADVPFGNLGNSVDHHGGASRHINCGGAVRPGFGGGFCIISSSIEGFAVMLPSANVSNAEELVPFYDMKTVVPNRNII